MSRFPVCRLTLVALGLVPSTASAAKTWSAPQAYSSTREVFGSQRGAMAADGTAFAIGASDLDAANASQGSVDLGVRTPGGTLSTEKRVVGTPGASVTYTQVVVDPTTGGALAIWCEGNGLCGTNGASQAVIKAYYRPPGGAWTALADVLPATTYDQGVSSASPALAMGPDGTAYVVFTARTGQLMIAMRPSGNGNFGAPIQLYSDGSDSLERPAITVGPDGNATIVFLDYSSTGDDSLKAIHAPLPGGPVTGATTLETLPGTTRAQRPVIAADTGDRTTVAWTYTNTAGGYEVHERHLSGGGSFSPTATLDADTSQYYVDDPTVTIDTAHRVHLAWPRYAAGGSGSSFQEAVRSADGSFGAPAPIIASDRNVGALGLAPLTDGSVLALWDTNEGVFSALSQTPGAWGSPVFVAGLGLYPSLAAGPAGSALATFSTSGNPPDGAVSSMSVLTDPLGGGSTLGTPPTPGAGDPPATVPPGTTPPSTTPPATTPPAPTPKDTTAPAITKLGVSPKAFRAGTGATAVSAAVKKGGAKITIALSEAGTTVLSFTRLETGVKRGSSCKAGKPGKGRKPCTLRKAAGSLTRSLRAGSGTVVFTGRVGSRALAAGRYELRAVATDAAGNASSPKTTSFAVLGK